MNNWIGIFLVLLLQPVLAGSFSSEITSLPKLSVGKEVQLQNRANLISTTWHQDWPFNLLCPFDSAKQTYDPYSHNHAFAGCGPVAMAQISKYYSYPDQFQGAIRYNTVFGELSCDFEYENPFEWDLIADHLDTASPEPEQAFETARLIYLTGLAQQTQYQSVGGSQTNSVNFIKALYYHMGFSGDAQFYNKNHFTNSQWEALLIREINADRPVLYWADQSVNQSPHAFPIDNYRITEDQKIEFRCLWSYLGLSYNYQNLDNLRGNPALGPFMNQLAVVNIHPPTSDPPRNFELEILPNQEIKVSWEHSNSHPDILGYEVSLFGYNLATGKTITGGFSLLPDGPNLRSAQLASPISFFDVADTLIVSLHTIGSDSTFSAASTPITLLKEHFTTTTLFARDLFPEDNPPRKGKEIFVNLLGKQTHSVGRTRIRENKKLF